MRTIYKYPLVITDKQTLMLPANAEVLTVAGQHGQPCIWALVDTDAEPKPCEITMCGTGMPCDCALGDYIGTAQLLDGKLVLHVFMPGR